MKAYRFLNKGNESIAFGFERLGVSHHAAVSVIKNKKKKINTHIIKLAHSIVKLDTTHLPLFSIYYRSFYNNTALPPKCIH